MPVNQKQIADALNLSINTVSRALRDHPDLAAATKARVLAKARELGYSKSLSAQPTPEPQHRRVGIILYESQDDDHEAPFGSGIKQRIFVALQRECQRRQVETLIETPAPGETPLMVKNQTIEAAFLFGRYPAEAIAHYQATPAVAVSSFIPESPLPRVTADNSGGMRAITEHLIELGHQRILFLGNADPLTGVFRERAAGYAAAMHNRGLDAKSHFCTDFSSLPSIDQLRNFTAIACSSDGLAYAVHAALTSAGLSVPADCSVTGFDCHPENYPLQITTYRPDWDLMGTLAADLLLSQSPHILNKPVGMTVPGKLMVRDTTCPPAL
ncbi:LacI family DNA-binding transcriptional regulator [Ruficoccus sp. ZRK36]|uniref:LacI family DNA-binding transcriptional regulator n=1 Tax=Ruficoccus sp. ZRK36 TaxID=2866311 RepID=UPI001C734940|nr:LacI family DNA-binding transcriptional regulator [Ruficoccus sp. ZRK36]QYY35238.1 LacI family transcriptional regulator [Ruficoccus sp. ZRK36]